MEERRWPATSWRHRVNLPCCDTVFSFVLLFCSTLFFFFSLPLQYLESPSTWPEEDELHHSSRIQFQSRMVERRRKPCCFCSKSHSKVSSYSERRTCNAIMNGRVDEWVEMRCYRGERSRSRPLPCAVWSEKTSLRAPTPVFAVKKEKKVKDFCCRTD